MVNAEHRFEWRDNKLLPQIEKEGLTISQLSIKLQFELKEHFHCIHHKNLDYNYSFVKRNAALINYS